MGKLPVILSIHYGHNATVGLAIGDAIVCLLSEERLCRIKNATGFPCQAFGYVVRHHLNGDLAAIDRVVINDRTLLGLSYLIQHGFKPRAYTDLYHKTRKHQVRTCDGASSMELLKHAARKIKRGVMDIPYHFVERRDHISAVDGLQQLAEIVHVPSRKFLLLDHHQAHATSCAYQIPGQDPSLIFTLDAEGDLRCATVSRWSDGKLTLLSSTHRDHSVGYLYRATTGFLGMRPDEHEFKVMGLAPYAQQDQAKRIAGYFGKLLWVTESGNFQSSSPTMHCDEALLKLLSYERFDHIAGGVQLFTEQLITRWVLHWIRKTGIRSIAVSGGVFMNVKACQILSEQDEVEAISVLPSAGDESLVIGGCYHGMCVSGVTTPQPLRHLYLGREFSHDEIRVYLQKETLAREFSIIELHEEEMSSFVAGLLAQHEIVARFCGREEWGARALGNRSILAHPADPLTIRVLNEKIKSRDFWMPFAPSVLAEDFDGYVKNQKNLDASFMSITFHSTPLAQKELVAALHPHDLTTRPHRISRETNPSYHRLISEFKKLTGIGGVLNTSFNLHGEPNVGSPEDAIHTLRHSGLIHVILGDFLVSKKS